MRSQKGNSRASPPPVMVEEQQPARQTLCRWTLEVAPHSLSPLPRRVALAGVVERSKLQMLAM